MACMTIMQQHGIIRYIGAVPNHYKLGYRFNKMTVWNIPDEIIDELGQKIGQLDFVSHCYHRPRQCPNGLIICLPCSIVEVELEPLAIFTLLKYFSKVLPNNAPVPTLNTKDTRASNFAT